MDSDNQDVFSYITTQESAWKTDRIPLTESKSWNMYEHIQRCTNVSNAWYHQGSNDDGKRPYDDIVTPIINVAFRTEGFDVKDIIPFVNDSEEAYKSFLVKKYQPKWARKHKLDTFIDDVVETSIIYDLVLVKDVQKVSPEVVDLKTLAFCDQTDIMSGPICIKHQYTIAELLAFKGKWNDDAIDMAILQAQEEKKVSMSNDQPAKTPSKYIEVYELRGDLPESWDNDVENGSPFKYTPQMHLVTYYNATDGKAGLSLFGGKDKPLADNFKALKIDRVRSKGRACGRSIVETLFEPQVWNNYSAIKIKGMLDSAITLFHSDSDEMKGKKLDGLPANTILNIEQGRSIGKVDSSLQNLPQMQAYQDSQGQKARTIGSASEGSLGINPTSGTPFALNNQVIQQGEGIHEYRQGKIATFFGDTLYPDLILPKLVADMNSGQSFMEELSLEEMNEISDIVRDNRVDDMVKDRILKEKKMVTVEERDVMKSKFKEDFMKKGSNRFLEILKDEFKTIPMDVYVNIKGKQRYMAQNADKITNVIREVIRNPQAFTQIPGIGKAFNQLLEESGMSPIDFAPMITAVETEQVEASNVGELTAQAVGGEELQENK